MPIDSMRVHRPFVVSSFESLMKISLHVVGHRVQGNISVKECDDKASWYNAWRAPVWHLLPSSTCTFQIARAKLCQAIEGRSLLLHIVHCNHHSSSVAIASLPEAFRTWPPEREISDFGQQKLVKN
mmetsp:Transcript_7128/g.18547  ORF Transcript_7128/g.18547 Transcript_7128/m.18547 type:complete len:126 (-) Transcript_7128:231-608(-)